MNTAKVGFAIILTCRENRLEILCVKRGHSSPAPGKWSFPGGKLGQGEGTEEAKTIARVRAQCGGGEPPGLPPLIHIIRLLNESSAKVPLIHCCKLMCVLKTVSYTHLTLPTNREV